MDISIGSLYGIKVMVTNTLPFKDDEGVERHYILTDIYNLFGHKERVLLCSQEYFNQHIAPIQQERR